MADENLIQAINAQPPANGVAKVMFSIASVCPKGGGAHHTGLRPVGRYIQGSHW